MPSTWISLRSRKKTKWVRTIMRGILITYEGGQGNSQTTGGKPGV